MELALLCLVTGGIVAAMMTALWLLSLALKDSGIVDIFWGIGFVVVNLVGFASSALAAHQILLMAMVTLWGLRLSIHIFLRNKGQPEDFRYARWRRENGVRWWWVSFFKVFALQGVLLWIIAMPLIAVQAAVYRPASSILFVVASLVWALGFVFEAVGDYQLSRFKSDPLNKGKILTGGLWRYTRHPNYFGDAVQWWGFYLVAAASGGWWTIFSPLLMTILLMRISGVTLLEKTLKTRSGYDEYVRKSSAFFPWFPKNS